MLLPNNKQKTKLFQYANASRFAYNWTIAVEKENYENGGKFILDNEMRKRFTQLKKTKEYDWLNYVSNEVTKQSIKDACGAYKRFFKGISKYPKFKKKKQCVPSFYQDSAKIQFTGTHVKFESLTTSKKKNKQKVNWIKLSQANRIPIGCKYYNPRIKFDGINWWLTIGIDCHNSMTSSVLDGIGVDLGIKPFASVSNGDIYKNINKTCNIKQSQKRKRRLQRSISRKYEKNKKGESYCKTCNIVKSEKELLKLNQRLTNTRQNYLHQITSEMIKQKPSFICIEDLNVVGMMKNKHLSKSVQEQKFYEFRRQLQYKCEWNGIQFIIADRWFPSSKLCHECGQIKQDLKLSDRIYKCECGNVIDRDYQAALNLKKYGENVFQSVT